VVEFKFYDSKSHNGIKTHKVASYGSTV